MRVVRDIIVIGAPLGGAAALIEVARALPAELPASIFVVLHRLPQNPILLADVLSAPGRLRVADAIDRERIEHGRIYVACDDHHLTVEHDHVRLRRDEPEHGYRPAIDVLFRTAAESHKERVVGVLLLRAEKDGLLGLHDVRRHGGRTISHRNDQMLAAPRHWQTDEELSYHHLELPAIGRRITDYVAGFNGDGSRS